MEICSAERRGRRPMGHHHLQLLPRFMRNGMHRLNAHIALLLVLGLVSQASAAKTAAARPAKAAAAKSATAPGTVTAVPSAAPVAEVKHSGQGEMTATVTGTN